MFEPANISDRGSVVMWLKVLLKDFRIIKLLFLAMTLYLLCDELLLFFLKRPTVISFAEKPLGLNSFPEIVICSKSGFHQKSLELLGYDGALNYRRGTPRDNSFIGWFGSQPSALDRDRDSFLRNISDIKTLEDCPDLLANFVLNGTFVTRNFSFSLTRAVYPHGQCCRALPPQLAQTILIYELELYNKPDRKEDWRVHLSDRESLTVFNRNKFNMEGNQLEARREGGFNKYKIKIYEETHLPQDS